jgi:hypothetical protein
LERRASKPLHNGYNICLERGLKKIEVGLKPISGRIVGTLLDAELADHISRNLYDRDYATAEWLVEQGVPFYKEITRRNIKILIRNFQLFRLAGSDPAEDEQVSFRAVVVRYSDPESETADFAD